MSAANPLRGEVALMLPGGSWRLRPSFARLVAAEAELGSLVMLVDRAAAGEVRLSEAETLFWHCIDGERPDRAVWRELLLRGGLGSLMAPYRALLTAIFAAA